MSIEITSQFNNKAGKPLDANSIKSTIAERDAITDRYIGLKVFVEETLTEYVLKEGITNNDWKEVLELIKENITEQQTLIDKDKVLIQDTIGSFKWISFANLKRQLGLQVGQKYLGGTIIQLNEDGTSGVIASYDEFEKNYTDALSTYSRYGTYVNNGYSNWRLPTISELNLLLTHSKSERGLIGDVNGDGIINNDDLDLIGEGLYKDPTDPEWSTKWYRADTDNNELIDGDDLNKVENIINAGGGSIFGKLKYLSFDLSDTTPLTHCKGYSAPIITSVDNNITVVPHALIEIPIVNIVGVRLVRNF